MQGDRRKERIQWIDLLRACAILCVVLCHVTQEIYPMSLEFMDTVTLASKTAAFSAFTVGRLGVPLFLMISGYLLLDRRYDSESCVRFWKHNWLHLLICTMVWWIIYDVFLWMAKEYELSPGHLIRELFFVRAMNLNHTWYMPVILGLYVLIPFVANGLASLKTELLTFPVLIFTVCAFGYPLLNTINAVLGREPFALQFSLGFSGDKYGLYLIFGYLIKKGMLKKIKNGFLVLLTAASYAGMIGLQLWAFWNRYPYSIWYDCLLLLICAGCMFELFSRIKTVPWYRLVSFLSYHSFAVYLIHNMVKELVIPRLNACPVSHSLRTAAAWLIVSAASFLCAWAISKIPRIGKYVLYES